MDSLFCSVDGSNATFFLALGNISRYALHAETTVREIGWCLQVICAVIDHIQHMGTTNTYFLALSPFRARSFIFLS